MKIIFNDEEFYDIYGYENKYAVSKSGKIYSYPNATNLVGRVLKQTLNRNGTTGYLTVGLIKNGVYKKKYVHRLVAETFLGREDELEVNHKDGNKLNNNLDNLVWVSHQENIDHCYSTGLRQRFRPKKRTKFVDVNSKSKYRVRAVEIDEVRDLYRDTPSCRKVGKLLGVSHETIRQALKIQS